MTGKLAIGGLVAVAVMALSTSTASAQYVVRHGNHYHNVSPAYGHNYGYQPVYQQPVYRSVYQQPVYQSAYNSGFGWNQPSYGGYNSGFGYGNQFNNGYGGGYGNQFNNGYRGGYGGGYGGGRQSFGLSFNFIR